MMDSLRTDRRRARRGQSDFGSKRWREKQKNTDPSEKRQRFTASPADRQLDKLESVSSVCVFHHCAALICVPSLTSA